MNNVVIIIFINYILSTNNLMIKNDTLFINEEIKTFYKDLIKIRKRGNITGNLLSPFRSRKYEKWEREYLDIADIENS